jgi:hypothetical protein
MKLKGEHTCCEEWALEEGTCKRLRLRKLEPLIENMEPILIKHELISWKGKDDPTTKVSYKYETCDISSPGIVCEVKNLHNLQYRLLDGSHRMAKMTLETDITESYFYVIPPEDFYSLLEDRSGIARNVFS